MIVLNVTYKTKPGMREAFLEAIRREGVDGASRAEAGNLKYDYYLPTEGGDTLLLVEHWRDAEALAAHAKTPHFLRLGALKSAYVTETVIEKYAPLGSDARREEQTVTITVKTEGEPCELTDEQIGDWYKQKIAALFDPKWGAPAIAVKVERK